MPCVKKEWLKRDRERGRERVEGDGELGAVMGEGEEERDFSPPCALHGRKCMTVCTDEERKDNR